MYYTIGFILLVILSWLDTVIGCSCISVSHPQYDFCTSKYVVKAKVLSNRQKVSGDQKDRYECFWKYRIKVLQTFKNAPDGTDDGWVCTPKDDGLCEASLSKGAVYVLSGSVTGKGMMTVDLCSWHNGWSLVDRFKKKALKKSLYKTNCDCQVNLDDYYDYGDSSPEDECFLSSDDPDWTCYRDHSYCKRGTDGSCSWVETRSLKKCLPTK